MRYWGRLAVLSLGIAAALTAAAPGNAARPDTHAVATVASLSAGGTVTLSAVPADFPKIMGYEPKLADLADGTVRVINPTGSCSVPGEGRPFDFAVACQAHDFGYDLLRYAERVGAPLPPQARDTIDGLLTDDLWTQCQADPDATACEATVAVFAAGVGFNSWRQLSGPPVDESGLTRTAGLVLLGGVAVGAGTVSRLRRRFGRRLHPVAA